VSAYRYTSAGRTVYVMGNAGRWWHKVGALPKMGETLDGPHPTRAAAIAAANEQINETGETTK
jgi:hypothetical protein